MVRKNIYITNSQERFLKSLEGRESDYVREALDDLMKKMAYSESLSERGNK